MGRSFSCFLGVTLILASATTCFADENEKPGTSVSVGFAGMPVSIEGLSDVHVSDWPTCGLGAGGECPEGRVILGLEDGNISAAFVPGLRVGARGGLLKKLAWLLEISAHFGDMTAFTVCSGIDWSLLGGEGWHLSLTPKVGFFLGIMNLGTAVQLAGYVEPVITAEGEFFDGAELSASMLGGIVSGGLAFGYDFTEKFGIRLDLGFQYAFMGSLSIKAGDVDIDVDSASVVKTDGSSTQAGISPEGSSVGLTTYIGFKYNL